MNRIPSSDSARMEHESVCFKSTAQSLIQLRERSVNITRNRTESMSDHDVDNLLRHYDDLSWRISLEPLFRFFCLKGRLLDIGNGHIGG